MSAPRSDTSFRYCYILSAGRSGSTLLNMLMGGHSKIAPLGECNLLGNTITLDRSCSCGATVQFCEQWSRVIERIKSERGIDLRSDPYALQQWDALASEYIDYDRQNLTYHVTRRLRSYYCDLRFILPKVVSELMPLPPSFRAGVKNTFYLYETILKEWNRTVIADKSKNVHHALSLYRADPERVRILFQVRDGRGVFLSKRGSNSRSASLSGWAKYNSRALLLFPKVVAPEHFLKIRYEDLVTRQEETLGKICELLQIDYEDSMISLGERDLHLVSGNKTMYRKNQSVTPDERWKTQLIGEDKLFFDKYGSAINRRLGYQ